MTKLSEVKPRKVESVLLKLGFSARSTKSSHVFFSHADGRTTTIPAHNRPIRVGTLRAILRQANISVEEFFKLL